MANKTYPKWKQELLQGTAGTSLGGTVKALLVDLADYTYDDAHDFLDDIPAAAREETSAALTTKTFVNGTFDSDNPVFTGAVGDVCEALVLFLDTGTPATSRLIAFYDTGVTGLPVTPNGGDINVLVNASGWFTL